MAVVEPYFLNGQQKQILKELMIAAFTRVDLNTMLSEADLGSLEVLVPDGSLDDQVFSLINLSEKEGWTHALIEAIRLARRENKLVEALLDELSKAKGVNPPPRPERIPETVTKTPLIHVATNRQIAEFDQETGRLIARIRGDYSHYDSAPPPPIRRVRRVALGFGVVLVIGVLLAFLAWRYLGL
jgi:hypothetical protein